MLKARAKKLFENEIKILDYAGIFGVDEVGSTHASLGLLHGVVDLLEYDHVEACRLGRLATVLDSGRAWPRTLHELGLLDERVDARRWLVAVVLGALAIALALDQLGLLDHDRSWPIVLVGAAIVLDELGGLLLDQNGLGRSLVLARALHYLGLAHHCHTRLPIVLAAALVGNSIVALEYLFDTLSLIVVVVVVFADTRIVRVATLHYFGLAHHCHTRLPIVLAAASLVSGSIVALEYLVDTLSLVVDVVVVVVVVFADARIVRVAALDNLLDHGGLTRDVWWRWRWRWRSALRIVVLAHHVDSRPLVLAVETLLLVVVVVVVAVGALDDLLDHGCLARDVCRRRSLVAVAAAALSLSLHRSALILAALVALDDLLDNGCGDTRPTVDCVLVDVDAIVLHQLADDRSSLVHWLIRLLLLLLLDDLLLADDLCARVVRRVVVVVCLLLQRWCGDERNARRLERLAHPLFDLDARLALRQAVVAAAADCRAAGEDGRAGRLAVELAVEQLLEVGVEGRAQVAQLLQAVAHTLVGRQQIDRATASATSAALLLDDAAL